MHYELDIPSVIRYAGNNYTGDYRNVPYILHSIRRHVPKDVFRDIERLLMVGSPAHFVGKASRQNFDEFCHYGNHLTVQIHAHKIAKLINKRRGTNNSCFSLFGYGDSYPISI